MPSSRRCPACNPVATPAEGRATRRPPRPGRLTSRARGALLATWLGLALATGPALADHLSAGDRALQAGRLEEALKDFEAAARAGSAPGQAGIGRGWLRRGRYETAMEAFRRAAEMDPAYAVPVFGQGEALRRQGRCEEALPHFRH